MQRKFDLNVEKILENWEVYHAVREIIANAIDEHIIVNSQPFDIWNNNTQISIGNLKIDINKDTENKWHIRDYGRGIKYEHLTQNENSEKLKNPYVIGKFGIGLKDALATFDRYNVKVVIKSKYGDIRVAKSQKFGFDDIITLHAYINPPSDPNFIGTEFILEGLKDEDIEKAKNLFLMFSNDKIIEKTKYGDVLEKKSKAAKIYINGLKIAEEENFLFSYNITSLTDKIKNTLNRERTNVGRNAYSDRIRLILLYCQKKEVAERLAGELEKYSEGGMCDEINWVDIQEHAVKILNSYGNVVFLTSDEIMFERDIVDESNNGQYRVIVIPDNLKHRISGLKDILGNQIRDFGELYKEYQEKFEFKFVNANELTPDELKIFNMTDKIFSLINGKPKYIKEVRISETVLRKTSLFEKDDKISDHGVWDNETGTIIIKRNALKNIEKYSRILLWMTAYAINSANKGWEAGKELTLVVLLGKIVKNVFDSFSLL